MSRTVDANVTRAISDTAFAAKGMTVDEGVITAQPRLVQGNHPGNWGVSLLLGNRLIRTLQGWISR
jgi:hypothetical protein